MATKKKKAAHGTGVCQFVYDRIRAGKTNDIILAEVHKKFPTSQLKVSGVSWCRNKLRQNGEKGVKTNRELMEKKGKRKDPLLAAA